MSETAVRFNTLCGKVGGLRRVDRYEDTFGPTPEEQHGFSPLPGMTVRILSEVEFAIHLSDASEGRYDAPIHAALDRLFAGIEEDGALTNAVCLEAEQCLLPLSEAAKEYGLILCGHAHIDMNWMWSYDETVSATVATFSTMLDIMDEYPDFCFSQSQASVYAIIDEFAPELHDRIKRRIDEGRWEVTASAWVETDKNMPSAESLLRHIKYTKNYFRDSWGIDPDSLEVDFSPDTFGHSANLAEIDAHGGVKYCYHCRALDKPYALYRWKGQSGREMLMYREQYWYNSGITPKPGIGIIDVSKKCAGLKTGLVVYGVGDHGGGPTRRDVEKALDMMTWPVFPRIKFGTFREFFHLAESVRERLPLVDTELNCLFAGCYTTQSRIKRGNRRSEGALADAETLSAFAEEAAGRPLRAGALEKAWRDVLFTHFHDILTGSCVQDSREYAMGLYQRSLSTANTEYSLAMRALSEEIDTSFVMTPKDPDSRAEGAGVGYKTDSFAGKPVAERGGGLTRVWNVFNPTGVDKKETLEITVWDYPGDLRYLKVSDSAGKPVEFQLIDGSMQSYWGHRYFRILLMLEVGALSYKTVTLTQGEHDRCPVYLQPPGVHVPDSNYILENDCVRAEISYATGEMLSFTDKASGKELICPGKTAGLVLIDAVAPHNSAWDIGKYLERFPVTQAVRSHPTAQGPLKNEIHFDLKIRASRIGVTYSLEKGASFVRCAITADWAEVGGERIPLLVYDFPLAYTANRYRYNIPAGSIVHEAADEDKPGLSYAVALDTDGVCAGIVTDCKYGFRGRTDELISTLINTAKYPDPYPERGIHTINLAIGVFDGEPLVAERLAYSINHPLTYQSTTSHAGSLPPDGTFLGFSSDTAVLSAVYTEGGMLTVRVCSVCDTDGKAVFTFKDDVTDAYCCTLMGEKTAEEASVSGRAVTVKVPAKAIRTVKIKTRA